MKATYLDRKKYEKYDDQHFIVYLNEEVIPDYVPEIKEAAEEEQPEPCTAFAYTGDMVDGGTLIEAKNASYNEFVSGLIRKKYSSDQVEAITLNKLSNNKERKAEFDAEFEELETYRNQCKEKVREWF